MIHRHLDYDGVPADQLRLAALDDLLERGDFTDWRSLVEGLGLEIRLVVVDADTSAVHEIAIP